VTRAPLIVAYHAVSSTWRSPLAISEEAMNRQLQWFSRRGFVGLTLADAERRRSKGGLPARTLVVTFDDGFASVRRARPLLDRLGFPATVFVVTGFVEGARPLDWPGLEQVGIESADDRRSLDWTELEELRAAGWEIGSHTATHVVLPDASDDELAAELEGSRNEIVGRLGSCESVSYPYGLADARVATAARRGGYAAGVTLTRAHDADEPLRRPRLNLETGDTGLRLSLGLSRPALALRRSRVLAARDRRAGRPPWIPGGGRETV
jgi:peptidoglycan/xylan/chitin deacetylase (PgdA/CDA1 family)